MEIKAIITDYLNEYFNANYSEYNFKSIEKLSDGLFEDLKILPNAELKEMMGQIGLFVELFESGTDVGLIVECIYNAKYNFNEIRQIEDEDILYYLHNMNFRFFVMSSGQDKGRLKVMSNTTLYAFSRENFDSSEWDVWMEEMYNEVEGRSIDIETWMRPEAIEANLEIMKELEIKFNLEYKDFYIENTWNSDGFVLTTRESKFFKTKSESVCGYRHCGNFGDLIDCVNYADELIDLESLNEQQIEAIKESFEKPIITRESILMDLRLESDVLEERIEKIKVTIKKLAIAGFEIPDSLYIELGLKLNRLKTLQNN